MLKVILVLVTMIQCDLQESREGNMQDQVKSGKIKLDLFETCEEDGPVDAISCQLSSLVSQLITFSGVGGRCSG